MDSRPTCPHQTVILQQNLGRKQQAHNQLLSHLINHSIPVALVQEPYTTTINTIPTNSPYRVLSFGSSERPRAAIFVSSQVHVIHLSQFTTRDLCACTLSTNGTTLTVVSVYIPPHKKADGTVVPIDPFLHHLETVVQSVSGKVSP